MLTVLFSQLTKCLAVKKVCKKVKENSLISYLYFVNLFHKRLSI